LKVEVKKYNPNWCNQYNDLKNKLSIILKHLNPIIEHIGSTSIPSLCAKPIIDIAVGIKDLSKLNLTIQPMIENQFIYYEVYNNIMPNRRLFVGLNNNKDSIQFQKIYSNNNEIPHKKIQSYKLTHIHVWEIQSYEWKRHIAFRDYLRIHTEISKKYSSLKYKLSEKEWIDGNEYNDAKNNFIKEIETKALLWYDKQIVA
tara:strand:- start:476 stop:1075 length:600 start_codon:yes stop_codon:yes gene_type:complete